MSLSDNFEEELIARPDHEIVDIAQSVLEHYGIRHVCYYSKSVTRKKPDVATNYADAWIDHYIRNRYHEIDPLLSRDHMGHRPINWCEVGRDCPVVRAFFGEANEFGIGQSGMTIPIKDSDKRSAYFSISTDMMSDEWKKITDENNQSFRNLAFIFHIYYQQSKRAPKSAQASLSERELQVLGWAAGGKSAWETSQILGLSQRTVDSYIRNCLKKLEVTNKTQAVAMAATYDLLEHDLYLQGRF